MISFNPLAMTLNQKPLDGNNFEDWKTNLYIVLDYEKIKFVLDTLSQLSRKLVLMI